MASQPSSGSLPTGPNLILRALGATDEHGVSWHRIIGIAVALCVFLLIVQNSESTRLSWLFFSFSAPVWVMMVITLILGGIAWEFLRRGRWRRSQADPLAEKPE
jgi:uncharacterized integral membrane protein